MKVFLIVWAAFISAQEGSGSNVNTFEHGENKITINLSSDYAGGAGLNVIEVPNMAACQAIGHRLEKLEPEENTRFMPDVVSWDCVGVEDK